MKLRNIIASRSNKECISLSVVLSRRIKKLLKRKGLIVNGVHRLNSFISRANRKKVKSKMKIISLNVFFFVAKLSRNEQRTDLLQCLLSQSNR